MIYKSECTYKAASRKVSARKDRSSKGNEHLKSRVQVLETRLGQALDSIKQLGGPVPQPSVSHIPPSSPPWNVSGDETCDHAIMELPPLSEVLPAVENYLDTCNLALPLFDSRTLLRSIHSWYQHPQQRDCVSWAAINVVLALAHRESDTTDIFCNRTTAKYLNRAQSVLTEVTMRGVNLINVQVVTGLVMLYQGTQDMGPPTMLVATALRLAHGLRLQSRRSSEHFDAPTALQRNRVFWIIYILDRDISMRIKQAPLQQDNDIDLDLPPEKPDADEAGFIPSADGRSSFNFFRARVQMAQIQGSLYDYLYSVRAQNSGPQARADSMTRIRHMLEAWTSRVSPSSSLSALSQAYPTAMLRYLGLLYGTRLACLSLVSLAHSWDTRWMEKLQNYGRRAATGDAAMPLPLPAPLPEGWETLVNESREFVSFFINIGVKDASLVW